MSPEDTDDVPDVHIDAWKPGSWPPRWPPRPLLKPDPEDKSPMMLGKEVHQPDGWVRIGQGEKRESYYSYSRCWAPVPESKTPAHVLADFRAQQQVWGQSECGRNLISLLECQKPSGGWQINKAVCLATGSFSRGDDTWAHHRQGSLRQLAAFLDVVKYLQRTSDRPIHVYAQDTVYAALDREFLESLGVTALLVPQEYPLEDYDGPYATDHFGPSSFVSEFCMEHHHWFPQALLDKGAKVLISSMSGNDTKIKQWQDLLSRFATEDQALAKVGKPARLLSHAREMQYTKLHERLATRYTSVDFTPFEEDPSVFGLLSVHTARVPDPQSPARVVPIKASGPVLAKRTLVSGEHFAYEFDDAEWFAIMALNLMGPKTSNERPERQPSEWVDAEHHSPDDIHTPVTQAEPDWETIEQLREEYEKALYSWRTSTQRIDLHTMIDDQRPPEGWNITEAICLATGTFHYRHKVND